MYNVYILKSINYPKTYVGISIDLERRLKEHNDGNSRFTKQYKPWKVIHSEQVLNRTKARIREKYFKSCAGRKLIEKIIKNQPK